MDVCINEVATCHKQTFHQSFPYIKMKMEKSHGCQKIQVGKAT